MNLQPFICLRHLVTILAGIVFIHSIVVSQQLTPFKWPDGKRVALSLTFDDARASQVEGGTALLDKHNVKATFYVVPSAVEKKLEGWKKAVASGHEIANHSLNHPCSGNFCQQAWQTDPLPSTNF